MINGLIDQVDSFGLSKTNLVNRLVYIHLRYLKSCIDMPRRLIIDSSYLSISMNSV